MSQELDLFPDEKVIKVGVIGREPGLLMNNPASILEQEVIKTPTKVYDSKVQAEKASYRLPDGGLYIPSSWFYGCLINASTAYRIGKKSATQLVAGCIRVFPIQIPLETKEYEINIQSVTIKGRGKIPRARPLLKNWEVNFDIVYDPTFGLTSERIHHMLQDGGRRIGVGDFRPQHRGQYGTFTISKWEEV